MRRAQIGEPVASQIIGTMSVVGDELPQRGRRRRDSGQPIQAGSGTGRT